MNGKINVKKLNTEIQEYDSEQEEDNEEEESEEEESSYDDESDYYSEDGVRPQVLPSKSIIKDRRLTIRKLAKANKTLDYDAIDKDYPLNSEEESDDAQENGKKLSVIESLNKNVKLGL